MSGNTTCEEKKAQFYSVKSKKKAATKEINMVAAAPETLLAKLSATIQGHLHLISSVTYIQSPFWGNQSALLNLQGGSIPGPLHSVPHQHPERKRQAK